MTLYRRHTERCVGSHPARSTTYESDEARPKWKKCGCKIHVSTTTPTGHIRKDTGRIDWEGARQVGEAWRKGEDTPPDAPPPGAAPQRTTIAEATERYLEKKKSRDIKGPTVGKYQTLVRQLTAFTAGKGYVMLDQITRTDMDEFYASWKDAKQSKGKKLERLRGFWKFAMTREYYPGVYPTHSPVGDLEPPPGYSIPKQKSPFDNDELRRIFEAAEDWESVFWHNGPVRGEITREHVITFCMLLTECGFAIIDGARFNIDERIHHQTRECEIRRTKNDDPVCTWINDDLYHRLMRLREKYGPTPFILQSTEIGRMADAWRDRLEIVFTAAGPFKERPTPHRFRHTFVRIMLERGVHPSVIANLTGDDEDTIRKYYSRWVPSRQKETTAALKAAYEAAQQSEWRPRVIRGGKQRKGA
jgi:site-specific recombinase XerD